MERPGYVEKEFEIKSFSANSNLLRKSLQLSILKDINSVFSSNGKVLISGMSSPLMIVTNIIHKKDKQKLIKLK